jgi:hypothetical protein
MQHDSAKCVYCSDASVPKNHHTYTIPTNQSSIYIIRDISTHPQTRVCSYNSGVGNGVMVYLCNSGVGKERGYTYGRLYRALRWKYKRKLHLRFGYVRFAE